MFHDPAQVTVSSELEGMEVLGAQQDGDVYGPGVGLTQIPWTEMQMEYEEDSETEKSRAYQGRLLFIILGEYRTLWGRAGVSAALSCRMRKCSLS